MCGEIIAIAHLGPGNENALDADIKVIQFLPYFPIVGMNGLENGTE